MGRRAGVGLAVLALLPLYRLGHQSFWYDELFTVWVARHPAPEIFSQAAADGYTPPLYYLLVAALWRFGLQSENLRLLSVIGGAGTLFALTGIATRLGGRRAGLLALAASGLSPFLFSFSQELRPYTAMLACLAGAGAVFLSWWARPRLHLAFVWGALLLGAVGFSYLALTLLPVALLAAALSPRPRQAVAVASVVVVLGLVLSRPALSRTVSTASHRASSGTLRLETRYPYPLARLLLGGGVRMPPLADEGDRPLILAAELAGAFALLLALGACWKRRRAALAGALSAFVGAIGFVFLLDALTGVGIVTRYLTLGFVPFVLVLALSLRELGRAGPLLLAPVVFLQVLGLEGYLFHGDYFRDDWRGLCARLAAEYRPGDHVWGFPFHHLAVAASFYGPDAPLSGGYLGREGEPAYFVKPGERFTGYELEHQLDRLPRARNEFESAVAERAGERRVLLVTYADDDWHGDTRPLVSALDRERRASLARFAGRETLLLRVFEPR
jgi:hypothetical protein